MMTDYDIIKYWELVEKTLGMVGMDQSWLMNFATTSKICPRTNRHSFTTPNH